MRNFFVFFSLIIISVSCKKDYSYEGGNILTTDSLAVYSCTGTSINGIYKVGSPLTITDSVVETVNVTTIGKYNITTDTLNGISFHAAGNFTFVGVQAITLVGTGTPLRSGNFTYKPLIGTGCSFSISVAAAAVGNATYTLVGSPNSCTGFTLHGLYAVGVPLYNNIDTVVVQVNVTVPGIFTLSTDTINGIVFSKSGIFTSTGVQNVILAGSGTPKIAETSTLTPKIGFSSCSFNVVVGPPGIITCKIDGEFTPFNVTASGVSYQTTMQNVFYNFGVSGYFDPSGSKQFGIAFLNKNGFVDIGTYTQPLPNGYTMMITYIEQTTGFWKNYGYTTSPPFNIVILSVTPSRITGTFSAKVVSDYGSGSLAKNFTEGVFDVPRQQ